MDALNCPENRSPPIDLPSGMHNNLIANQLSITEETVKSHVEHPVQLGATGPNPPLTIGVKRGYRTINPVRRGGIPAPVFGDSNRSRMLT